MSDVASAILDAAERRMRVGGFKGFSFRDIADDVGVKSSSVHYHFPTKEKLVVAVIRRYGERVSERFDTELSKGTEPAVVWAKAFRGTLHSADRICPATVLGAGLHDLPEEVAVEIQQFFRMHIEKMVKSGLSADQAAELLSTTTGAVVVATALGDLTAFDRAISGFTSGHSAH